MCDTNSRKRKRETRTVKGIFKKDDLDDSLSTSDWGLGVDNNYRSRARNKTVIKLNKEPLTLICEWNECYQTFSEFGAYNNHIKQHLEEYISEYDQGADLTQHVVFHAYHNKLKCVGQNVENRANLPDCTLTEKFVIPVISGGYICEWEHCNEYFETVFDFFEHVRLHVFHNPKGPKEGAINCCWKGCTSGNFGSRCKLAEHMRIHTKEKIIACPTCGNLFSNKTKFCDHRKRQLPTNLQSYLCSQCSKYFPSERLLRDHMRLHINQYKCSMCEMTCPKPSILAKHFRYRHLKEKPFKCDQCDYRCVSKHNLDFHLKKHDSNNQLRCTDCGYKCKSAFGLKRHHQKTHKELGNVYECHNCKKRFFRGGHLTRHLLKVHNYHWPSGHSRFRYKEDPDGVYRLQTVRYETLDVTEEIIKGKTAQAPPENPDLKFELVRKIGENSVESFEVVVAEKEAQPESPQKILITINDVDPKGNVLSSQTIPAEIICSDVDLLGDNLLTI